MIGLFTKDPEKYYEAVRYLKDRDVDFQSLSRLDVIPSYIKVILTTEEESRGIQHNIVHLDDDIEASVEKAVDISRGRSVYNTLIIGIDPGKRPGVAVIGDSEILNVYHAMSVEKVKPFIEKTMDIYTYKAILARIGDGAPIQRDRLINELVELDLDIEMVDETSTSRGTEERDIKAAISISYTKGRPIKGAVIVEPTNGEVRNLQRISRIESRGEVTISRDLALAVLKGEMSLEEAIRSHKRSDRN